ncbi:hypothetical protein K440DRAFT_637435 [Wilcoxina mikolae CBS 423.85]|nr:hypothetical protein K440DRAFT_637435 [Wilcoxina mikolae CBS 423.85]
MATPTSSVDPSEEYRFNFSTPAGSDRSVSTWRPQARTNSIFCTSDHRSWSPPVEQNETKINFYPPYRVPPTITCGLTGLDIDRETFIRIKAYADNIRRDSFYIHLDAWSGTTVYEASCTWLETTNDEPDFQVGTYKFAWKPYMDTSKQRYSEFIKFDYAFDKCPNVVIWLNQLDLDTGHIIRIKTYASDITTTDFTIHIDTWDDSIIYGAGVSWIAYPCDHPGIFSGNVCTTDYRDWHNPDSTNGGDVTFPKDFFHTVPKVLLAVNYLDFDHRYNLRFRAYADRVWQGGMKWHVNSWADTICYNVGAAFLAFS